MRVPYLAAVEKRDVVLLAAAFCKRAPGSGSVSRPLALCFR